MHYPILKDRTEVRIKTLIADESAPALFRKAIDEYVEECESSEEIRDRLASIEYSQMAQIQTRFSEIEIGMDNA